IPQLGFGVFQIKPAETVEATAAALEVGYRHIDTAEMYGNEKEVGEAIRRSGVPREEVFVTSKLNNGFHAHDAALKAFDGTLEANFALFDFELSEGDMAALTGLDRGERTGPDPDTFNYIPG